MDNESAGGLLILTSMCSSLLEIAILVVTTEAIAVVAGVPVVRLRYEEGSEVR